MDRSKAKQTTTGLVLIAAGVVVLGSQLDWGPGWTLKRLWPLIMIAAGVPGLLFGDENSNRGGGLWVALTGGVLLLHTLQIMSLRQSWPLFIVAIGASVFIDGLTTPAPKSKKGACK